VAVLSWEMVMHWSGWLVDGVASTSPPKIAKL